MAPYGGKGYGSYRPPTPSSRPSPYAAREAKGGGDGEELSTLWVGDLPGETGDQDLLSAFVSYGDILSARVGQRPAASGARSGFVRFQSRAEAEQALNLAATGNITVLGNAISAQWARSNTTGGASGGGGGAAAQESWQPPPPAWPSKAWAPSGPPLGSPGFAIGQAAPMGQRWGGGGAGMGNAASQMNTGEELATLWIGNLVEGTGDAEVAAAFGALGQVVSASVQRRASPMGSYSGFVRFATRQEAQQVLEVCAGGQMTVNGSPCIASWAKVNSKIDPALAALMPQGYEAAEPPPRPGRGPPPAASFSNGGYNDFDAGYERGLREAYAALGLPAPETFAGKGGGGGGGGGKGGHKSAEPQGPVRTLFIGSLPVGATQEEVKAILAEFGVEGAISLNKPSARGLSGFIRFPSHDHAEQALQFLCETPIEVQGQQLVFDWAKSDSRGGE